MLVLAASIKIQALEVILVSLRVGVGNNKTDSRNSISFPSSPCSTRGSMGGVP